ncbi:hypothetical protein GU926_16150 [Nibribacter ruber]|uniref:Uncharacterized protein n=1 Tax=Nibribacter ruber TaxID=2698458 RepID=A0A6P1P387_9BACT|nr:hypothetical protein [Nibribacter ruber]QHL88877.1 hypothetical protein GU926_16150 [Nibribacter ruber]
MEKTAPHFPLIEKETIPELQFGQEDVWPNKEAQKRRLHDLERASRLGNGYQGKVEVTFQIAGGDIKRVQTTIWQVDQEFVTLKSGVTLPLRSVLGVEFF